MYQKLCKGMAIYRQEHTNSYYVRLRVQSKEIRRTLSTSDLDEATTKAWALKFELEGMAKAGIEILKTKELTVEQACKSIIEELDQKKPQKDIYHDYKLVYRNFIIPFFKRKSISELTTKNIRLYFESREFSKTRKTINRSCFTRLFNYLEEEGKLKKQDYPTLPKEIKTAQMQIGVDFAEADLKKIKDFMQNEIWLEQSGLKPISQEYRNILPHVFEFLLETGIRTGEEMNSITFKDIKEETADKKKRVFVKITGGKTSYKNRDAFVNKKAVKALVELLKITKSNNDITKDYLVKNRSEEAVFLSSHGKICDFCKLFDQLIKKMIKLKLVDTKYTLYSCRHTYITKQLTNGSGRDFMHLIALQVGNSLEMIQNHYNHSRLKDSKNINQLDSSNKNPIFTF
ncbi:site-specific integrase [Vibrio ostreicida]|uniref:site-specific integrase n=1 Tax=Vibrio ostreicida TaxID=526588 RepID=UPI003B593BA7